MHTIYIYITYIYLIRALNTECRFMYVLTSVSLFVISSLIDFKYSFFFISIIKPYRIAIKRKPQLQKKNRRETLKLKKFD